MAKPRIVLSIFAAIIIIAIVTAIIIIISEGISMAGQIGGKEVPALPTDAVVSWHEGDTLMRAWTSQDEVALILDTYGQGNGAENTRSKANEIIKKATTSLWPGSGITESRPSAIFLKGVSQTHSRRVKGLQGFEGVKYLSSVYYTNKNKTQRMALTGEIIVRYRAGTTARAIGDIEKRFNLSGKRLAFPQAPPLSSISKGGASGNTTWEEALEDSAISIESVFVYDTAGDPIGIANAIYATGKTQYCYPNWLRPIKARTVDGTIFSGNITGNITRDTTGNIIGATASGITEKAVPNDPQYSQEWHLNNTGQWGGTTGADIDVQSVWDTYRASGKEVIAVVDDGLEIGHEDLSPNVIPGVSYNYVTMTGDPTAVDSSDAHGTSCGGIAAARGFNGIGVIGVAPEAGLVAYNLLENFTDSNAADAFTRATGIVDIYTNSWGPDDTGDILEGPSPVILDALESSATNGRGGLGSLYFWAGGNGYVVGDNSNDDGFANSRFVFAISATTNNGTHAYYSEKGANILVNAPSSGGTLGITTTTLTSNGKYTSQFGGTSAASPIAAGAGALLLEANPNLTRRDVRFIVAASATKNDPGDTDWTTNSAGLHVNHKYGFGRLNVADAINVAKTWQNLPAETTVSLSSYPNLAIPDFNSTGVSDSIYVPNAYMAEFVEVVFNSPDHKCFADLDVILTSPSGTKSNLAESHTITCPSTYAFNNWKFGSVRHLGENTRGTWTLTVRDRSQGFTGTFQSWTLNIYGNNPYPIPMVYANGTNASISIRSSDVLILTVSLSPGIYTNMKADWWLFAKDCSGNTYHFDPARVAWIAGAGVSYQGPMVAIPTTQVLKTGGLPVGTYTVTFGVDLNPNGVVDPDSFFSNTITVTVSN
ncbi:MAG: S8 family serine peptidase [Nitrospirae bacterium]|nr:S8 family serine peptidase [Nitrospirota bacterium]